MARNVVNENCLEIITSTGKKLKAENQIGTGAFGYVLKVCDENGFVSAVKIVPTSVASVEDTDELAYRKKVAERETLFHEYNATTNHPFIVQTLEVWQTSRHRKKEYVSWRKLQMEALKLEKIDYATNLIRRDCQKDALLSIYFFHIKYYPDGNLDSWLRNNAAEFQNFHNKRVAFSRHILTGVEYLHSKGLIHRDLSPTNILLDQTGDGNLKAVISDFGTIISCGSNAELQLTKTCHEYTRALGTGLYAAPEVMFSELYGKQCDLYSIGVIFLRMHFNLETSGHLHSALLSVEHDKPKTHLGGSTSNSEFWLEIIKKQISRRPELRIGCTELLQLLDKEYIVNSSSISNKPQQTAASKIKQPLIFAGTKQEIVMLAINATMQFRCCVNTIESQNSQYEFKMLKAQATDIVNEEKPFCSFQSTANAIVRAQLLEFTGHLVCFCLLYNGIEIRTDFCRITLTNFGPYDKGQIEPAVLEFSNENSARVKVESKCIAVNEASLVQAYFVSLGEGLKAVMLTETQPNVEYVANIEIDKLIANSENARVLYFGSYWTFALLMCKTNFDHLECDMNITAYDTDYGKVDNSKRTYFHGNYRLRRRNLNAEGYGVVDILDNGKIAGAFVVGKTFGEVYQTNDDSLVPIVHYFGTLAGFAQLLLDDALPHCSNGRYVLQTFEERLLVWVSIEHGQCKVNNTFFKVIKVFAIPNQTIIIITLTTQTSDQQKHSTTFKFPEIIESSQLIAYTGNKTEQFWYLMNHSNLDPNAQITYRQQSGQRFTNISTTTLTVTTVSETLYFNVTLYGREGEAWQCISVRQVQNQASNNTKTNNRFFEATQTMMFYYSGTISAFLSLMENHGKGIEVLKVVQFDFEYTVKNKTEQNKRMQPLLNITRIEKVTTATTARKTSKFYIRTLNVTNENNNYLLMSINEESVSEPGTDNWLDLASMKPYAIEYTGSPESLTSFFIYNSRNNDDFAFEVFTNFPEKNYTKEPWKLITRGWYTIICENFEYFAIFSLRHTFALLHIVQHMHFNNDCTLSSRIIMNCPKTSRINILYYGSQAGFVALWNKHLTECHKISMWAVLGNEPEQFPPGNLNDSVLPYEITHLVTDSFRVLLFTQSQESNKSFCAITQTRILIHKFNKKTINDNKSISVSLIELPKTVQIVYYIGCSEYLCYLLQTTAFNHLNCLFVSLADKDTDVTSNVKFQEFAIGTRAVVIDDKISLIKSCGIAQEIVCAYVIDQDHKIPVPEGTQHISCSELSPIKYLLVEGFPSFLQQSKLIEKCAFIKINHHASQHREFERIDPLSKEYTTHYGAGLSYKQYQPTPSFVIVDEQPPDSPGPFEQGNQLTDVVSVAYTGTQVGLAWWLARNISGSVHVKYSVKPHLLHEIQDIQSDLYEVSLVRCQHSCNITVTTKAAAKQITIVVFFNCEENITDINSMWQLLPPDKQSMEEQTPGQDLVVAVTFDALATAILAKCSIFRKVAICSGLLANYELVSSLYSYSYLNPYDDEFRFEFTEIKRKNEPSPLVIFHNCQKRSTFVNRVLSMPTCTAWNFARQVKHEYILFNGSFKHFIELAQNISLTAMRKLQCRFEELTINDLEYCRKHEKLRSNWHVNDKSSFYFAQSSSYDNVAAGKKHLISILGLSANRTKFYHGDITLTMTTT